MKNEELKEAIAKYIESKELVLMGYSPEYIDDIIADMEIAFRDAVENIFDKHFAEMSVEYSIHCKVKDRTRRAIMDWDTFQKVAQKFIDIGKTEALNGKARNITANLLEDKIEGIQRDLIEFAGNVMEAGWADTIKAADGYANRITATVMKDLPRWEDSQYEMDAPCVNYEWLHVDKKMIYLPDLKKLPGFKEDSHE